MDERLIDNDSQLSPQEGERITHGIFHRIDDIGPHCSTDLALIEQLANLHSPYILSVIPAELSPLMATHIRKLSGAVIFQHGYSHINESSGNHSDEFPDDRGKRSIRRDLLQGKQILEDAFGRVIIGYVPPWNRISVRAIETLEELGFRILSAHTRSKYDTCLVQVSVSIDPIHSYRPTILKPMNLVRDEIDSSMASRSMTGMVYHSARYPPGYAKELYALLASIQSSWMMPDLWNRVMGHEKQRTHEKGTSAV